MHHSATYSKFNSIMIQVTLISSLFSFLGFTLSPGTQSKISQLFEQTVFFAIVLEHP